MNRRSFFSLAGLGALAALFNPKAKAHSILDLEPLDLGQLKPLTPEEKLQDAMLKVYYDPGHSHSISDPGHNHQAERYLPMKAERSPIDGLWRAVPDRCWHRDGNSWQLL